MDLTINIDDNKKLNIRAVLLIRYKDEVLVETYEEYDYKWLPGGRIRFNEDSNTTIIREIKEEMNLDLTKYNYKFSSILENFFIMDNIKYHEYQFIYTLDIDDKDLYLKLSNMPNNDSKLPVYYKWIKLIDYDKENVLPKIGKEAFNKINLCQRDYYD